MTSVADVDVNLNSNEASGAKAEIISGDACEETVCVESVKENLTFIGTLKVDHVETCPEDVSAEDDDPDSSATGRI